MMSSYVQSIVNEFSLRAKSKIGTGIAQFTLHFSTQHSFKYSVSVIFEPGTRKFVYGTTRIPLPADTTAGGERKAGFFRKDAAGPVVSILLHKQNNNKQKKPKKPKNKKTKKQKNKKTKKQKNKKAKNQTTLTYHL